MNNVIVRSISGAVYVALIVAAIFLGHLYFMGLMAAFAALAMFEVSSCAWHFSHRDTAGVQPLYPYSVILDAFISMCIVFCIPLLAMAGQSPWYGPVGGIALMALVAYLPVRIAIGLFECQGEDVRVKFQTIAMSLMGVFYVSVPLALLNFLYITTGHALVLSIFIMIWLNDTGAFCFGVTLGKRRLWESLSPKKSWEGFWGGMFCCVVFGMVWSFFPSVACGYNIWIWMIMAILVSVFSTWGDLFESLLKRACGVKDSSHLIPGHGGILDRIDSLLLVAPAIMFFDLILLLAR